MTNKYEMKNITLLVIKNISTSVKSVLFPVSWWLDVGGMKFSGHSHDLPVGPTASIFPQNDLKL